jgi:polyhydroxyalkanoate synthesis regulator phasin
MEDLFKRFLYTGVGFVALTAEKLQESIDEMVGNGKISEEEGKKLVDDFLRNTEERSEEFERKLRDTAESVMEKLSFPSKAEYETLLKRVEHLEAKLSEATQKKPTTRKRSSKKKSDS